MFQNHLIFVELHNLAGKTKNINVIGIVTCNKEISRIPILEPFIYKKLIHLLQTMKHFNMSGCKVQKKKWKKFALRDMSLKYFCNHFLTS